MAGFNYVDYLKFLLVPDEYTLLDAQPNAHLHGIVIGCIGLV